MTNGMRRGETYENHPDWNAVEFLEGETQAGLNQLEGFLEENELFLDEIDWKTVPRSQ